MYRDNIIIIVQKIIKYDGKYIESFNSHVETVITLN